MASEPLSSFIMDLDKVDTSKPCPIGGDYVFTLADLEVKPSQNGKGNNFFLTFQSTGPLQSIPNTRGESVQINNYKVTECCVMWQGDNPNQPNWKVKIARIYDALMGTDDDSRPRELNWAEAKGKRIQLTLKPEEDPQYGLQARIQKFKSPPSV